MCNVEVALQLSFLKGMGKGTEKGPIDLVGYNCSVLLVLLPVYN
jgi:hypothetical protein